MLSKSHFLLRFTLFTTNNENTEIVCLIANDNLQETGDVTSVRVSDVDVVLFG